jgi:hypothetical protein
MRTAETGRTAPFTLILPLNLREDRIMAYSVEKPPIRNATWDNPQRCSWLRIAVHDGTTTGQEIHAVVGR